MDREDTRDHDCRKKYGKYDRSRDRYGEGSYRVIDRAKYSGYISDKKEHKRSTCPKKMVIYQVDGFSDFFCFWDVFISQKLWDDVLEIGTPPAPSTELFVLGSDGFIEIFFVDEVHLTDRRGMDDAKFSSPSEITPPVLKSVFDDRCQ